MSETPKTEFNLKKAALTAAGISAASAILLGSTVTNAIEDSNRQTEIEDRKLAEKAYHDAIEAAINAEYDRAAIVDSFELNQGDGLLDPAEEIVIHAIGEDVYKANKNHLYDYLRDSALAIKVPQPGRPYYVVEVDLDPANNNGNEYIVTDGRGGFTETPTDTIPSPTQR